ncbi:MAG: nucleotidyltransferase domain-containing protein [archaeon]
MGQDILNIFFENPTEEFHIRGIAKELNIPKTTVGYHINHLLKESLIIKNTKGVFTSFRANESSEVYRFYKREEFLKKLMENNLLDYLEKEFNPKCIILFGSFAKAEYDKKSDIDLFIQAKESKYNLEKYEKILKHKINLFFEPNLKSLSQELLNNIVNGIKLRGFIRL